MHHMDMSQQHLEAKYEHIIGTINISSVNSSAAGCWSVGPQLDALLQRLVDLGDIVIEGEPLLSSDRGDGEGPGDNRPSKG